MEHVGCESDVYCVTRVCCVFTSRELLGYLPDDLNPTLAHLYICLECFKHEPIPVDYVCNFVFPWSPPHALQFFPRNDSPAKPQLTPKPNA